MAKWVFTRSGTWHYPSLGFRATGGDILDAPAAPDSTWESADAGLAETVDRYSTMPFVLPGERGRKIPDLLALDPDDEIPHGTKAGTLVVRERESLAPALQSDFEGASPWGFGTVVGDPYTAPEAGRNGSLGLVQSSNLTRETLVWSNADVPQGFTHYYFAAWIRWMDIPTTPAAGVTLSNNQGVNHGNLFYDETLGRLRWDLLDADAQTHSEELVARKWYRIELRGTFGTSTYELEVRINGRDETTCVSTGQTPGTFYNVRFGTDVESQVWTRHIDDVRVKVANETIPWENDNADVFFTAVDY